MGYNDGFADGLAIMARLVHLLLLEQRYDAARQSATDAEYRNMLLRDYATQDKDLLHMCATAYLRMRMDDRYPSQAAQDITGLRGGAAQEIEEIYRIATLISYQSATRDDLWWLGGREAIYRLVDNGAISLDAGASVADTTVDAISAGLTAAKILKIV